MELEKQQTCWQLSMSVSITKLQNLLSMVAETVSSFGRSKVGPKQTPESGKKLMNKELRTKKMVNLLSYVPRFVAFIRFSREQSATLKTKKIS